jgi:hypothetical protein
MNADTTARFCSECGNALKGPFCAACGAKALPEEPLAVSQDTRGNVSVPVAAEASSESGTQKVIAVLVGIALVGYFIYLFAVPAYDAVQHLWSTTSSTSRQPTQPLPDNSACVDPASLRQRAVVVDFKALNKNPDAFSGKIAQFSGKIDQISETSDGSGWMRLAVTRDEYGIYDDDVYVEYNTHTDAVEKDIVTVYGFLTGSET